MVDPDDEQYAARLVALQGQRWKRLAGVQVPYRWMVRRLALGRVLEVGCGIGRNLEHLGDRAVGVDANVEAVRVARSRGFEAYATGEFFERAPVLEPFDTLLASHLLEHVGAAASPTLLAPYVDFLRPRSRLVMITPQEAGFRSDPTHVELLEFDHLERVATALGFTVTGRRSFPFPRPAGRRFRYNEFIVVADRTG